MAGIDSYTRLMLHCDGADASTTFTDSSLYPKTMTAVGNMQIDTAQYKFGGASGLGDGSGDYLTTPNSADFDLGASGPGNNFTLDWWVRWATVANTGFISPYSAGNGYQVYYDTNGLQLWTGAGTTRGVSFTPSANTWYHIAYVRSGTTITLYSNGVSLGTVADGDFSTDGAGMELCFTNGTYSLNGWIDEIRISKGIARWTQNFAPPTSEYTIDGFRPNKLRPRIFAPGLAR